MTMKSEHGLWYVASNSMMLGWRSEGIWNEMHHFDDSTFINTLGTLTIDSMDSWTTY